MWWVYTRFNAKSFPIEVSMAAVYMARWYWYTIPHNIIIPRILEAKQLRATYRAYRRFWIGFAISSQMSVIFSSFQALKEVPWSNNHVLRLPAEDRIRICICIRVRITVVQKIALQSSGQRVSPVPLPYFRDYWEDQLPTVSKRIIKTIDFKLLNVDSKCLMYVWCTQYLICNSKSKSTRLAGTNCLSYVRSSPICFHLAATRCIPDDPLYLSPCMEKIASYLVI